jgi:8-oxo-dGTP pyrophosphatase MutT (NUDIX family)
MKKEESFGIIPLIREKGHWSVFLIQLKHGRYWGFPKGHPELNETPKQTAVRELKEETNLDVIRYLQEDSLSEQYHFTAEKRHIFKRVEYFVAEVAGEIILQKQEVQSGLWVPFSSAIEKVTHSEGKSILVEVGKILLKEPN